MTDNPYAAAKREQKAAKISSVLRSGLALMDAPLYLAMDSDAERNAHHLAVARGLDRPGRREIEKAAQVTSPSSDETWELAFQMLGRLLDGMFDGTHRTTVETIDGTLYASCSCGWKVNVTDSDTALIACARHERIQGQVPR